MKLNKIALYWKNNNKSLLRNKKCVDKYTKMYIFRLIIVKNAFIFIVILEFKLVLRLNVEDLEMFAVV